MKINKKYKLKSDVDTAHWWFIKGRSRNYENAFSLKKIIENLKIDDNSIFEFFFKDPKEDCYYFYNKKHNVTAYHFNAVIDKFYEEIKPNYSKIWRTINETQI